MEVLGRDKVPVDQATDKDLNYWAGRIREELHDPTKERFRSAGERKLAAIEAEQARRKSGGAAVVQAPAAPAAAHAQPGAALARPAAAQLSGTFSRGADVTQRLADASAGRAHLIAPATACDVIPEGCAVALSVVSIDVEAETYDVGMGKRALSKAALDRIGAAAGISWDATQSRRLDDGRDPHYCVYYAVGSYRHFDGVEVQITGTKEMDLRDGSPQVEALEERARAKGKTADAQVREMRLHILAHAESKAKLRATRSIGIRSSYTREELARPFVVAKLMFTGQSDDADIRRMFAAKRADAMLGGHRALYGVAPAAPQPGMAFQAPVSAPPLPALGARFDADEDDGPAPPRAAPAAPPSPPRASAADAMSAEDIARAREIDRGDNPEDY